MNPLSLLGRELQEMGGGRSFPYLAFLDRKVHCEGRSSKGRYNCCSRLSVGERIALKPLCTTLWKSQRSLGEGDVTDRLVLLAGGKLRGMQCNIPLGFYMSRNVYQNLYVKTKKMHSTNSACHKRKIGSEMGNGLIRVI